MELGGFIFEHNQAGPLRIWEWPKPECLYVLGADACGGMKSGDSASGHVVRADTGSVVAVFHDKLEPSDFAHALYDLGHYYGGREAAAFCVPENNNHGHALVLKLRDLCYPNLFFRVTWDNIAQKEVTKFGWSTTPQTRAIMLAAAQDAVKDPETAIPCPQTLEEMRNFVFNEAGKAEAAPGENDDMVMSFALAQVGRRFCKLAPEVNTTGKPLEHHEIQARIVEEGKKTLLETREVVQTGWI